ncbi:hypothetical protein [Clostridium vincentii]|uniref:Lipoprotein n=1 Tax=Clostridium vincentii TaxID=52704 RepID=A0A2T0BB86_9CLOT|nr:hypothetical protein [Clostridium vincentii]PRR81151.1 hypothetical protein CLVI_27430 [Clostridium vincentii]
MIKKISVIICLCLGLTFVACTNDTTDEKADTSNSTTTKDTKDSEDTTDTTESDKETKVDETPVAKDITLTAYTANVDTYAAEKLSDITVKEDLPLQEKLTALANEISTKVFGGLPITIVEIQTIDGKKKAIINLVEKEVTDPNASWSRVYFQGSAGGTMTSNTLIETFAQRAYTGEWIDSMEFQYNGGSIETQHAPKLTGIITRN